MDHQTSSYSPAVCLRLIDDNAQTIENHCSLCAFFHGQDDDQCQHSKPASNILRTATPFSDCSFYTAQSDASEDHRSVSSRSSSSTIRATVRSSSSSLRRRQSLRRTSSPTECSLRDLHHQQAERSLLRQQESEEQLQRVYESQILAYLNADYAELETINE